MQKNEFTGKKVLVFGLGLNSGGVGSAQYFSRHGAHVVVTDLKSRKELIPVLQKLRPYKNIQYVLGLHRNQDILDADIVVQNPGVPDSSPFMQLARRHHKRIITDVEVFFTYSRAPIFGVTGTKGKSTTTTLLYELCKAHTRAFLGGNVTISMLDFVDSLRKTDRAVLELSSFQLETLSRIQRSPHIAVITNLGYDHLNRYASVRLYWSAKKNIYAFQKSGDIVVLNYDNAPLRSAAKKIPRNRVYWFSVRKKVPRGMFLRETDIVFTDGRRERVLGSVTKLKIVGRHNYSNVLAAVCAAYLDGVSVANIRKVLSRFNGVPHRLEFIGTRQGRAFYDDTTATVPAATIFALQSFEKPVVLIAGGSEKYLDFSRLARVINRKTKHLILMKDAASHRLLRELKKNRFMVPVAWAASMQEAVRISMKVSERNDVILLSPACASFGLFQNEFDRGNQFQAAFRRLKK
jgi:UDP-N-acetylmuramoylalanine--D-glutamate ligase